MKKLGYLLLVLLLYSTSYSQLKVSTHSIKVNPGWNLLSLPATVTDSLKSSLFPDAASSAFIYDNGYYQKDTLQHGYGFWLKFNSQETISISGYTAFDDTLIVKTGWNIIGSLSMPIAVNTIKSEPEGIIASQFYTFNNSYKTVDTLQPGAGYWVKVNGDGKLILKSYTISPDVKLLTDTLAQHLVSISTTQDTLEFDTNVTDIEPGQILVSDVGEGLLRRVTSIQPDGDGIKVLTTQASLVELFTDADVTNTFTITEVMVREIKDALPGIRRVNAIRPNELRFAFEDVVLWDQDHNLETRGDQVTVSGYLSLALKPHLELKIREGQLSKFDFTVEITSTTELTGQVPLEIPFIEDSIKIFTIRTTPVPFFIGPVPVVITNDIPIYLGLDGSVRISLTAGIKNTSTLVLGARYENGQWAPIGDFSNNFEFMTPSIRGEVNMMLYVKPQLETKLYSVIGPIVYIKGYAEGNASVDLELLTGELTNAVEFYAGVRAGIGVKLSIFDFKLAAWEYPFAELRYKLWDWDTTYYLLTPPPTGPHPPNNAMEQQLSVALSWSCNNPEHFPLKYDVYFGQDTSSWSMIMSDLEDTSFTKDGLIASKTYFWKVIVKDTLGQSKSGPVWRFTTQSSGGGSSCVGTPTVSYLGKTYNTVQIGTQCWLKDNLDVGTRIDGSQNQTNNSTIEKYCYNNDPNNCSNYGGLYQWNEAMQYTTTPGTKGICPTGWHIPTYSEFQTLSTAVGDDGNALKAIGQGTGTNTSGFSALLSGNRNNNGNFNNLGNNTNFWSSTENNTNNAYNMNLNNNDSNINYNNNNKKNGFSVRCVKDSKEPITAVQLL